ncbi:MAG: Nramp family divalent metal transporter [Micrococcaceae bacterium]
MTVTPKRVLNSSAAEPRRTGFVGRLIRPLALIGPAFIAGTWQFGPGSLTTSIQAGNEFGFKLLWVVAISTAISVAFTDMSVRIALRTDESIVATAKRHLGRFVGFFSGFGVFLLTLIFSVGNAVAAGASLSTLFGGPPALWMLVCTLAVVFVAFAKNVYRVVERGLIALLAIMAVGFVASALMTSPQWGEVGAGMIPTIPPGSELLIIALAGTNFSINAAFYISYAVRERKVPESSYREVTFSDTIPGITAPGVMAVFVVIAAVASSRSGLQANTIGELGSALEPIAGPAASVLFSIGFFAAAFSSMVANSIASGTVLSDSLGWGSKLSSPRVKMLVLIPLTFGGTISIIAGSSPVSLIVTAQALTVLVAPFVGLVLLILACKKDIMGRLRLPLGLRIFGVLGFAVLLLLSFRLVLGWF